MKDAQVTAVPAAIILTPECGTILRAFGDTVTLKLSGEETKGSLALLLDTAPPGQGPPPHIHHHEDELLLIVKGTYRFFANGQWTAELGPGAAAYTPRGALHTFQNVGREPSSHWVITTPSGFEQFFAKCAEVFADHEAPPNIARIQAIGEQHGLEFVPPLLSPAPETA